MDYLEVLVRFKYESRNEKEEEKEVSFKYESCDTILNADSLNVEE